MNADRPLNISREDIDVSSWIDAVQRKVDPQKDPYSAGVEERFRRLVADREAADRVYDRLPLAYGGKVINPDTAREILPEYQSRGERMANTIGTGVASAYAKDRLERELADPRGRTRLVLMAGGPGAGKSTFLSPEVCELSDLIFDATLRETEWARRMIALALEHGWEVVVCYVQRPMEDVYRGVVLRAHEHGRWFPIRNLVKAHSDAQRSAAALGRAFADEPRVRFAYHVGPTGGVGLAELVEIEPGGAWGYWSEENERGERETLEREDLGDRPHEFEQGALSRENQARLRGAIRAGSLDRRLVACLARGDERLLSTIREIYGSP